MERAQVKTKLWLVNNRDEHIIGEGNQKARWKIPGNLFDQKSNKLTRRI